jgi:hypothetical protein
LYRSHPSLFGPDLHLKTVNKRRSEGDKYFPSQLETSADILKYTSKVISSLALVIIIFLSDWDTHGSLITLNFGEDDRLFKTDFNRWETFSFGKESHSFQKGFHEISTIISYSDC